jgi:hypothetical protein
VPLESGAANEIVACGTAKLAGLLQHTYGGSMLDSAVYREGSLADGVCADPQALL